MATIVTLQSGAGRCAPGPSLIRRLDMVGPVLLLAAVLGVLAAAGYELRSGAAAAPLSLAELRAA